MKIITTWSFALLAYTGPAILMAQSTADKAASATDNVTRKDEVIELSPFVVTTDRDYGYRAANSITATGIGSKISDTPVGISVLTSEFLEDSMITNMSDAMQWMAGTAGTSVGGLYAATYQVRGYNSDPQVDGNPVAGGINSAGSSIGVDRVEVIKGPSAVFHGNAQPGGTISIIYKMPSATPRSYVMAKFGSYNFASGTLFATGPLIGKKLTYLVEAYKLRSDGWVDHTGKDETAYAAALSYTPFKAVTLNLSYRDDDVTRRNASIPQTHTGFLESGLPASTNPITWVIQNFGPNEPYLNMNVPASYLPGGYRFNTVGPQNFNITRTTQLSPEALIKINDYIDFRQAFNFSETRASALGRLNQTGIGPGGVDTNRASWYWDKYRSRQTKSELALKFHTGPIAHSMLFGYAVGFSDYRGRSYVVPTAPVNSDGQPWLWTRDGVRYLQDEIFKANPSVQRLADNLIQASPGTPSRSYYVTDQISALNGRLIFLLGARHTDVTPSGGIRTQETTPQAAVLVKPFSQGIKKDTSLFLNYTNSFQPRNQVNFDGTIGPPQEGLGIEFGVKTDWKDGAVVSTVSVFMNTLTNIASTDILRQSIEGTRPWWVFSGETESKGAEFDLVLTPARNTQIGFNWTYLPTAEVTSDVTITQQVGLRFAGVPVHAVNLFGKHTFVKGLLKGGYVGGGANYRGTSRGNLHQPAWWRQIQNPEMIMAQAFLGYAKSLPSGRKLDMRLNIQNLTNRGGLSMGDTTRAQEPRSYYLTVMISQ